MIRKKYYWRRLQPIGFRFTLRLGVAAAAVHAALLVEHVRAAQIVRQIIALSGEPVPGGNGNFVRVVGGGVINDSGQVAFVDQLQSTSNGVADGVIYRWDSGTLVPIVRYGDLAPGGNGRFDRPAISGLNNAGQVTFFSNLAAQFGQALDDSGIYRGDGGPVTQISREGQPAPDANGSVNEYLLRESTFLDPSPDLNHNGQAAFGAQLSGTSGGTNDDMALFRGGGGSLIQIVREGQPAPGGNGIFSSFGNPTLNDAGQSAFAAQLNFTSGGLTDDVGIYRHDGGPLTQIVRAGQSAPGGNGAFTDLNTTVALNESGQVAFQAALSRTGEGIFLGDGGALTQVAISGQSIPGATAFLGLFEVPALNNVGQTAFAARLFNAGSGDADTGLFRSDGGPVTLIAREGQVAPGGIGRFDDLQANTFALNDRGDVAFSARLEDFSIPSRDGGVFYYSDRTGLMTIVREGDALLGSTVTSIRFIGNSNRGKGDKQNGLNNRGQIAYSFTLEDNRTGIALAAVIPEPKGLALAALAGFLMVNMRSRADNRCQEFPAPILSPI